jgi:DNA-binding MarR family transcriptional regulator
MDRRDEWPTGRMLSAVARRIEREWNAHLAAWDLNHASLPVLFFLLRGPLSQRELARASGVTEQTMSRIVARLERSGYVRRQPDAADARRHEVSLTDAGRRALLEAGDPHVAEEMSVRGLDADQVAALRVLLAALLAAHPQNHLDPYPNEDPHAQMHRAEHDAEPDGR